MWIKNLIIFLILIFNANYLYAKEKLIVFHAGSLAVPFAEIEQEFEKQYPGADVLREVSGSRTCARKIVDLGRECDVIASADYTVIDELLIPEYAEENIKFATNEMVIMYTLIGLGLIWFHTIKLMKLSIFSTIHPMVDIIVVALCIKV